MQLLRCGLMHGSSVWILSRVEGSGPKGRILKGGRAASGKAGHAGAPQVTPGFALPKIPVEDFAKYGEIEVMPLSRMKKLTGARLQKKLACRAPGDPFR